ncbi:regulatory protein RecX [Butyrivibrio sp. FCS014]|uniref:regulatory protein RecX n=1 Tax=Butyrivibrio sp. FCS014 TaxID=1408304 RepID=UPI000464F6BD|nr:regulatory protein RecX [Butyrivibrio sp. FCS014]
MVVSELRELDKKRVKIFLDGEFAFVLYKGELREYKVKEGLELDYAAYRQITEDLLPKRCKLRAMNLLQKRDYTERQLRDKLQEGLYPEDIIDEAIDYVKSYKYLDDDRYARDYISYHMESRSRARIMQDLMGKGIAKDIISDAMEELYAGDDGEAELEQIRSLLIKKHYDPDNSDLKEKQKIMGFLLRRGFPMSLIRKAISED